MKEQSADQQTNKEEDNSIYRNPMAKGEYRNHPCICGGGKKMKHCHGKDAHVTGPEYLEIMRLGRLHNQKVEEFNQALIMQAQVSKLKIGSIHESGNHEG